MLDESREVVIKLFHDYSSILSKANHKAKSGKGLKRSIPKQIPQRLSIVFLQVKAGTVFEIRQIRYSLYQEKNVTKKVCNNIMNLRKL